MAKFLAGKVCPSRRFRPSLERLEDRLAPAFTSFDLVNGILTIHMDNLNEFVTVHNDGTEITLDGSHAITGAGATFTTADVHRIVVTDVGGDGGQSITFGGATTFTLSGGFASTGVEVVVFDNAVTATGSSSIAVTAPQSIFVNANLTGGTGGVSLTGQGSAALDTVGVTVQYGAVVSAAGSGAVTVVGTGGSGTDFFNFGVFVTGSGSQITSSGGAVSVTGTGGGSGSSGGNYGVYVEFGGVITSAGTGTVTVVGQGGNTSGTGTFNYGVYIDGSGSQITSSGGAVHVTGTGGGGTGGGNFGVLVNTGGVITSAGTGSGATVTVEGTGGSGTGFFNYGVYVFGSGAQITSSGGAVAVTATGNAGTNPAEALRLENFGAITSGVDADITITADSVNLLSGTSINSGSGTTTIRTRTAGTRIDLGGADVLSGSPLTLGLTSAELNRITAGTLIIGRNDIATGTVTVSSAVAPANATALEVITARDIVVNANITGGSGGLMLSANQQATPTAENFVGVTVQSGAVVSAAVSGTVTVAGKGGSGTGGGNYGVHVVDSGSQITSSGGAVSVTGTGGGSGTNGGNYGVAVFAGGVITSAGTGTVTVVGQGGNTSGTGDGNPGVLVTDSGSQITSSGGAVSVTGTGGGSGTSGGNYGVLVTFGGAITSAGTGSGATVTVVGQGGNTSGMGNLNLGVYVFGSGSQITSSGGAVSVTGTGGGSTDNSNHGVFLYGPGSQITSSGGADITITADSVNIVAGSGGINSGSGTTTIRTRTAGTRINLGGADVLSGSPLTLGLTSDELNQITAGTLVIGDEDAGELSVTAAIALATATNVELRSGGGIVFDGGSINTGGGTLLLAPGTTPAAVQPKTAGTDAAASTVSFASDLAITINGTTVDTQYTQLKVAGTVDLTGVDLVLNGSYTPLPGDVFTIVTATQVAGQFNGLAEGAIVHFNGVKLKIAYTSTTVTLTALGAPVITSVIAPANGIYTLGQAIDFRIVFNQPVTVAGGMPYLRLNIGGKIVKATLVAGSGTNTLTFRYVVAASLRDFDGITLASGIVLPKRTTIRNASNQNADLAFTPPDLRGVLVSSVMGGRRLTIR